MANGTNGERSTVEVAPPVDPGTAPGLATAILQPSPEATSAASARDPIRVMMEILEHPDLAPTDKRMLVEFANHRFRNRRRMAYLALGALIANLGFYGVCILLDGVAGTSTLAAVEQVEPALVWLGGFFASIVGFYYGTAAWRPAS